MKLSKKDLRLQELILTRIHNCSIEEARERELRMYWCCITLQWIAEDNPWMEYDIITQYLDQDNISVWYYWRIKRENIKTIIWQPPTLPRVLKALWDNPYYNRWMFNITSTSTRRTLLDDNNKELSLRDQSEEIKDILLSIL